MQVTVDIPDELAASITAAGQEPSRAALEALTLEAYRQRRISGFQLRTILGLPSRWALEAFLKDHQVYDYTYEDFEKDLQTIAGLRGN